MILVIGAGGFIGSQVCRLLSTRVMLSSPSIGVLPPLSLTLSSLVISAVLIFSLK